MNFNELLPVYFHEGHEHRAILGIMSGMMIVSISLLFL